MNLKHSLSVVGLLFASTLTVFAQKDTVFLHRAYQSLKAYSEKRPVEKVYLQLDKSCYAAGDDIWFKAYVTAGVKHELSAISGVLNVELIDYKNVVSQSIKLPIVSGLTWGDFKLPDTLSEGNYRVRAYTNWMRNAGAEYFYDKTISIGNSIIQNDPANTSKLAKQSKRKVENRDLTHPKINLQFFPEGGNLVYGITSQVAFKAVGEDGFGKDIKGVVLDDQNQEVTKFSSQHLGMGAFNLSPVSGRTYKARITYADSTASLYPLPMPVNEGYALHINNANPGNIIVQIEASAGLLAAKTGIYLVAQSGGEIYYAAENKSMSSSFTAVIPKNKFPTGITQFTLFSKDGEPLNERLVFVQNNDQLKLSISTPDRVFNPREKMKIAVCVTNAQNKTAFGNFSVAVIDETKLSQNENESSIFSNLLLTSDIKGYIEQPNYYFTDVNAQTKADLDVLMLTQGYHRFEWKHVLNDSVATPLYRPETSLEITGRIRTLGNRPSAKVKVSLMSSSAGFFMLDTLADDKGRFVFKNLQFADSTKFVVQSKKKNNNIKIELDSIGTPATVNKYLPTEAFVKDSLAVYLTSSKKIYDEQIKYGVGKHNTLLREVKIKDRKPVLTRSANLNGPGNADQVIMADKINTGCGSVAECLVGKLKDVYFQYNPYKQIFIPTTNIDGKPVEMSIKIDGVDISDEALTAVPTETIESVEILRTMSYISTYGEQGNKGIILINTKKGGYTGVSYNSIALTTPKGYYKARVFYSPQYDDPKTNAPLADLRTTVYWNPNVFTDKEGNISFDYFNAGNKGNYKLIIEGIDGAGNLGRQVYSYKVE